MAGVLQFTLGLEASKFLSTIGLAGGKMLSLAGVGQALQSTFKAAWSQIERGAALNDLSKRTGESVSNLFMLQRGFQAAGISADGVASSLFLLDKSLGGVNDMGEDTSSIFAKAGLSVEQLKKAGGAGAMQAVLGKMAGMDQTSATAFASKVFGRGQAADMVQASRQLDDFNQAMAASKGQAQGYQRVSELFDQISKAVERVGQKLEPVFLVIADRIAPAIKSILDWINSIDLTPLAEGIGAAFDVFAEAFSQGRVFELLSAGFDAAVEYLGNMLFGVLGSGQLWSGIWDYMVGEFQVKIAVVAKAFLNLGGLLKAAIGQAFDMMFELIGKVPKLGKYLGLEGYQAGSFSENLQREKQSASGANQLLDDLFGSGVSRAQKGLGGIGAAFAQAQANAGGEAQNKFSGLLDELLTSRKSKAALTGKGKDSAGESLFFGDDKKAGKGDKREVTALEKMGFVFGSGGGGAADTTAKNTTTLVAQNREMLRLMSRRAAPLTNASQTA